MRYSSVAKTIVANYFPQIVPGQVETLGENSISCQNKPSHKIPTHSEVKLSF